MKQSMLNTILNAAIALLWVTTATTTTASDLGSGHRSNNILLLLPDAMDTYVASIWANRILYFTAGSGKPAVQVVKGNAGVPSSLFTYGALSFRTVICVDCPSLPRDTYEYLQEGGNLLVAAGQDMSVAIRELAYEFSIDFDDKATRVLDYSRGASDPSLIKVILPNQQDKLVLYRGIAHKLTRKNPLAYALLPAPVTAFSDLPDSDKPLTEQSTAGSSEVILASAVQTRNNSRVVFMGSGFREAGILDADSGKGTVEFLKSTAEWVHGVAGHVEILSTMHHRVGEDKQHGIYRIKDELEYHATLATIAADGSHQPFEVDDLQVEVVMLDPYIRAALKKDAKVASTGGTSYSTSFTLPDVHGVYTLKLNYRRHGITYLTHTQTVQVRPFRHNEYPRFLSQAFPYYAGVFSQFAAFFILCALWMYHRDGKKGQDKASKVATGKAE